jgi:hypothetical protein
MAFTCNKPRMLALVEALESGEYEQAQNSLRDGGKFCCLGVACDIAAKDGIGEWELLSASGNYRFSDGTDYSSAFMPSGVVEYYDVGGSFRDIIELAPGSDSAMSMNDNGSTFTEIAAAIRRDYDLGVPA